MNAIEDRGKPVIPQQPLVFEENIYGGSTRYAHREGIESRVVEGSYPLAEAKMFHHFADMATQLALPAERVDAVSEWGRDPF
jgi:hypothetical protein